MEKKRRKRLSLLIIMILTGISALCQAKSGLESYNYMSNGQSYLWMPIAHYQAKNGFYSELRYNYEEENTISVYGGKSFYLGKEKGLTIIPMAGLSGGKFYGISAACKTEYETDKLFISSEFQYSMDFNLSEKSFFFSWSEIGINVLSNYFIGGAVQTTIQNRIKLIELGFVAGLSFGRFSVPLYLFSPFKKEKWFLLGINYEFQFKKKR